MTIISKSRKDGIIEYFDDAQPAHKDKTKKCPPESVEQENLNHHCRVNFPEYYGSMFHVVNESGGKGSTRYGARLNRQGRKKGVPDWPVMVPSNGYHGLFIELKRQYKKDSSLGKEQRDFLIRQKDLGYKSVVAYGYKAALQAIKEYLTPQ